MHKLKLIRTCSLVFFRSQWGGLNIFRLSSHRLLVIFPLFILVCVSPHSSEKRLDTLHLSYPFLLIELILKRYHLDRRCSKRAIDWAELRFFNGCTLFCSSYFLYPQFIVVFFFLVINIFPLNFADRYENLGLFCLWRKRGWFI